MISTHEWCTTRDHPWVTYNAWLDHTWCRCGQRHTEGEQPVDWTAKRQQFHSCAEGGPCRCYLEDERES